MPRIIVYLLILTFSSCGSVKYYIVRHAEKESASTGGMMNTPNDPPLSAAGKVRATELREVLRGKGIRYIFSTNTIRTIATAQPLNELRGVAGIELYNTKDSLDLFIEKLLSIKNGNSLIVGHSNTVDDIVNKLTREKKIAGDLEDWEYDNLYIVTRNGRNIRFETKKFGATSIKPD